VILAEKRTELDVEKKPNEILTKRKKKKKGISEHSACANPPPKALTQKAQRRRVCASTNVHRNLDHARTGRLRLLAAANNTLPQTTAKSKPAKAQKAGGIRQR
jgi:hypothetical protein